MKIMDLILCGVLGACIASAFWYGMGREIETREMVWRNRCMKWGENMPPQFQGYCDELKLDTMSRDDIMRERCINWDLPASPEMKLLMEKQCPTLLGRSFISMGKTFK